MKTPLVPALLVWFASFYSSPLSFGQSDSTQGANSPKNTIRETTVYIPFSRLKDVFEKEGRGVFLPYDQFQQLWQTAQQKSKTPPTAGPPVAAIIAAATSEATVRKDVVQVSARLTIELLREGWNTVPLRLNSAAIQSATIDGQPARISATKTGYELLYRNDSQQAKTIELDLVYSRAFDKSPGENVVRFDAPQAPVNRWRIRIPQEGVKVAVEPMIAATEETSPQSDVPASANPTRTGVDDDQSAASESDEDARERPPTPNPDDGTEGQEGAETVLLAFVGAAPEVTLRWTPKSEGASGLTALTSVRTQQEIYVSEGALRTQATLEYSISRATLKRLVVAVPADQKVVNVFDPNIRKWDVEAKENGEQTIAVELFEPAGTSQRIRIELEKFLDSRQMNEWIAPELKAIGVGRQQGVIVVHVGPTLRAETTEKTGLLQIDQAELPPDLSGRKWTFAYRYAALPYELAFRIEKVQPRINVESLVEYTLQPNLVLLDFLAVYDIERSGIFQLELDIPAGFEMVHVRGKQIADATAAAVDSYHVSSDGSNRLVVNLARKALGKTAIQVAFQRRLEDENLMTPTGIASELQFPVPEVHDSHLRQTSGRFVIYAPESLRLNPTSAGGLRSISFSELYTDLPTGRSGRIADTQPSLAYAFSGQTQLLSVAVVRRNPHVTARQRMLVRIQSGVVKYESLIHFDIMYSGVAALRVDVPQAIADKIQNAGSGLRSSPMDPVPDDVADGNVAWTLGGETELIGKQIVRFTWEEKIGELAVGSSRDIGLPRILPMGTDRAWGQIVVAKADTLDVAPSAAPVALRSIDPVHDVMADMRVADAAMAFEFHDDWQLNLNATRYELEEVKRTSVERALVRSVLTRSGKQACQVLYRLRSARQRLAIDLPEGAEFSSEPARVNGRAVALERGDQDLLYVPLVGVEADQDFVLELRYTLVGDSQQIQIPVLPEDPAVQKVYLAVFLPKERRLLSSSGPWTDEFEWRREGPFGWHPAPNRSDDYLAKWVAEGITSARSPAFQKDGVCYLYSALRPAPPPDGQLRLWTIHGNMLTAGVMTVLIVVGLLFLRSSLSTKIGAVTVALLAGVVCGVFAPTLAMQVLNLPMVAGLATLAVGWSGWSAVRGARQLPWQRWTEFGSGVGKTGIGKIHFEEKGQASEHAARVVAAEQGDSSNEPSSKSEISAAADSTDSKVGSDIGDGPQAGESTQSPAEEKESGDE